MSSPTAPRLLRAVTVLALCLLLFAAGLSVTASSASAATDSQLASRIVASVNSIRKAHGLAPLTVNYQLTRRADTHTRLILDHRQLKERFPGEADPATCLVSQGYWAESAAISVGWSGSQSLILGQPAYEATHSPMSARLLSSSYTTIGVAVRPSANGDRYVMSIVYARPMTTAQIYASRVVRLLNSERAAHGIPVVHVNADLIASAHSHNLAMAKSNEMTHQVIGESVYTTRISRAGYHWRYAGENIGWNSSISLNGALALETDMYNEKAPNDGHRLNILSRNFTDVGIDVYLDNVHHKLWLTEDFGRR